MERLFEHDLEERCYLFAKRVRVFCRRLISDTANIQDIRQLVRSSGSVGANYIEASGNLGQGDLRYRIKVCKKGSKESVHFLGLLELFENKELEAERAWLIDEANQFRKIFSTMLKNMK